MDAVYPQHNPVLACAWTKRGEDGEVRFDDTINADSTIALFEQLEQLHLAAAWIYVIYDNARYHRSKAVKRYLKHSRIKLVFLPPYAPNLIII
jgi:transposase